MKYTPLRLGLLAAAITGTLFFTACRKDQNNNKDNDTTVASDNSLSEFIYDDVNNIADDASDKKTGDNLGNYKTASNCATITHDTLSNPKTITVDFGPTNCLCNDGRYRRGMIQVSYTGKYKDSGSVRTITFNNYYVNNNQVLGNRTVHNMGKNGNNQTYFTISVNGLIIKANTLDSVIWNSNRVRTWVQGEATQAWSDDVYEVTGTANGQKANGQTWTMTIVQPLVRDLSCNWISAGTIELQPTGKALRTIDFGNGSCDNQATVTINGNVYTITLN